MTARRKGSVRRAGMAAWAAVVLSACTGGPDQGHPVSVEVPTQQASSSLGWTPVPPDSGRALPPGRYGLTANGQPGMPWAVVEVREPLSSFGDFLLHDEESDHGGLGYWTVTGVYRDPCRTESGLLEVGSRVEDLAAALRRQQRSRVTEPVPITLDDRSGLYLELQAPSDIDFASCGYDVWDSTPGGGRYLQAPGQVDRIWIVDVNGDILVFHATVWAGTPKSTLEDLTHVVESVQFVPRA